MHMLWFYATMNKENNSAISHWGSNQGLPPERHCPTHTLICVTKPACCRFKKPAKLHRDNFNIWYRLCSGISQQNNYMISECPGTHFTKDFSVLIQIRWKFHSAVIQAVKYSLWNSAHGSAAVLSWHVQNFVAIYLTLTGVSYSKTNFPLNLKCNGKIVHEMGPGPVFYL